MTNSATNIAVWLQLAAACLVTGRRSKGWDKLTAAGLNPLLLL